MGHTVTHYDTRWRTAASIARFGFLFKFLIFSFLIYLFSLVGVVRMEDGYGGTSRWVGLRCMMCNSQKNQ